MGIGVIIIGDEILSGRRTDKHLPKIIELLSARGLSFDWAEYVGDDPARITATLARTFASGGDIVFSTGGASARRPTITRASARAKALGVPLGLHPEAAELIRDKAAQAGDKPAPCRAGLCQQFCISPSTIDIEGQHASASEQQRHQPVFQFVREQGPSLASRQFRDARAQFSDHDGGQIKVSRAVECRSTRLPSCPVCCEAAQK